MDREVIADASPLIGLSIVDGLDWLPRLFGHVAVPDVVCDEVLSGRFDQSETRIRAAFSSGALRLVADRNEACQVTANEDDEDDDLARLDAGEKACIRLALRYLVERPATNVWLLMDDQAGRRVALANRLQVMGCAGLIQLARKVGLIPAAKPIFARLHAAGFWLAPPIVQLVLRSVGE